MIAAQYFRYGPPEVVEIKDIPIPGIKPDEVLIKVHATTVNRTDCGFRSAEYFVSRFWSGLLRPRLKTLGCEFAGEITEVGKAVTNYKVSESVFGYNDKTFGAHAEYLVLPANGAMATIPAGMTFAEAAPLTEGSHYALCDIRAAKIVAGQNVLVYGATGAIGSAAVQLLKAMDVRVTAVCGTKHVATIQALGVDEVIDYLQQDYSQTTQRFDLVFDAVGKTSFGKCKPILKPNGRYVSTELGKNGQNIWFALFSPILGSKKVLFPIPTITPEDVAFLKQLAESGKFKPLIDRQFPLTDIVEAYRFVETGQKIGNVVITVG
jgi:NADPH:quinone reductase-like Zn-dependent oxidoreductase